MSEWYTCPKCGDLMPYDEAETHDEVCTGEETVTRHEFDTIMAKLIREGYATVETIDGEDYYGLTEKGLKMLEEMEKEEDGV